MLGVVLCLIGPSSKHTVGMLPSLLCFPSHLGSLNYEIWGEQAQCFSFLTIVWDSGFCGGERLDLFMLIATSSWSTPGLSHQRDLQGWFYLRYELDVGTEDLISHILYEILNGLLDGTTHNSPNQQLPSQHAPSFSNHLGNWRFEIWGEQIKLLSFLRIFGDLAWLLRKDSPVLSMSVGSSNWYGPILR